MAHPSLHRLWKPLSLPVAASGKRILYMLEQFPRNIGIEIWESFSKSCQDGTIVSHRESQKLLELEAVEQDSLIWSKQNSSIFRPSTTAEVEIIGKMMEKKVFDFLITPRLMRRRMPEESPFLLAITKRYNCVFVYRKNIVKDYWPEIKKVCDNYNIKYMEVEECLIALNSSTN